MAMMRMPAGVGENQPLTAEYKSVSVSANTAPSIPTSGKARAVAWYMSNENQEGYVVDGQNSNHEVRAGTEITARTYTFTDTAITGSTSLSSSAGTLYCVIFY